MVKLITLSFFAILMKVDLLLHARWTIPVEPDARVLNKHALAISSGRIVDILPQHEANEKYQADITEEFNHHALIPGLINAHTHAPMSFLRGIADDLPLNEWLEHNIWPLERKWVSEAFVRDGTELAIAEMIRGGTTCFNDMYFFPEITARQVIHYGMRACIGLILIDFPSAWAENSEQYMSKGIALHDQVRNESLITTAFAPHAPYSVSDKTLERMRILAEELELPVHMHVHETKTEISQSLEKYGVRPLQRLQDLGIMSLSFIAVHMTQLNEDEIQQLSQIGCTIVHCPESNLKLASGFCPVASLLDAGINIALGTDSAASNNDLDMLGEIKTAALLAKGIAEDPSVVPAYTVLRMATLNGAKALGLEANIGSLEIGKFADLVAINLDTIETQPLFDPISQIVYAANRDQVTDVWVCGRRLLKSKELTTMDIASIKEKTKIWAEKLRNT